MTQKTLNKKRGQNGSVENLSSPKNHNVMGEDEEVQLASPGKRKGVRNLFPCTAMVHEQECAEYHVFIPPVNVEKRGLILGQRVWSIGGWRTSFGADRRGANASVVDRSTEPAPESLAKPVAPWSWHWPSRRHPRVCTGRTSGNQCK